MPHCTMIALFTYRVWCMHLYGALVHAQQKGLRKILRISSRLSLLSVWKHKRAQTYYTHSRGYRGSRERVWPGVFVVVPLGWPLLGSGRSSSICRHHRCWNWRAFSAAYIFSFRWIYYIYSYMNCVYTQQPRSRRVFQITRAALL